MMLTYRIKTNCKRVQRFEQNPETVQKQIIIEAERSDGGTSSKHTNSRVEKNSKKIPWKHENADG